MNLVLKKRVNFEDLRKFGFVPVKELRESDVQIDDLFDGCDYMNNWLVKMDFCEDYDYDDTEWIANGSIGKPPIKRLISDYTGKLDVKGFAYIIPESRKLHFDINNNDCSYHLEGNDLELIYETVFNLTSNGILEKFEREE